MIVGFTGTRAGMTGAQIASFSRLLTELQPTEFVHGDCVGADAEAHSIALEAGIDVYIRPCDLPARANCAGAVQLFEAKRPLDRNRDIVDSVDVLVATPNSVEEQVRSGTWYTVRYARKVDRKTYIINPDGGIRGTDDDQQAKLHRNRKK